MSDAAATLALLQHGDSAYPAGGFAFSWGVEGLAADELLTSGADLDEIIADQLHYRWQTMDRPLLLRAWDAPDIAGRIAVDRYCEIATPIAEMRIGSRRAGRALLGVSRRQGGVLSGSYLHEVDAGRAFAHLPVAQALVYRDAGFERSGAELLSGWTLLTGLVSAATRLDLIGHIQAQSSLARARAALSRLLAKPVVADAEPSSFTPLIDISIGRAPSRSLRMFTT